IYGPVLKNVLTFIVPLATVAYFPVGYLTGRITSIIALISPVLGVTALLPVTVLIWKLGLKHYASTGT
ncbi:MAG: ABC-2 family transporter protein, partial [Mesotoga infera]